MPGYKAHLAGGFLVWSVVIISLIGFGIYDPEPQRGLVFLAIVLLGALFPDIDTNSKGQNLFYICLVILDIGLMIQGHYKWAAILGFCAMLPAIGHHRSWTHTWWAMLLVPSPIVVLPIIFYGLPPQHLLSFYFAAVLGYFSHLMLDRKFF